MVSWRAMSLTVPGKIGGGAVPLPAVRTFVPVPAVTVVVTAAAGCQLAADVIPGSAGGRVIRRAAGRRRIRLFRQDSRLLMLLLIAGPAEAQVDGQVRFGRSWGRRRGQDDPRRSRTTTRVITAQIQGLVQHRSAGQGMPPVQDVKLVPRRRRGLARSEADLCQLEKVVHLLRDGVLEPGHGCQMVVVMMSWPPGCGAILWPVAHRQLWSERGRFIWMGDDRNVDIMTMQSADQSPPPRRIYF